MIIHVMRRTFARARLVATPYRSFGGAQSSAITVANANSELSTAWGQASGLIGYPEMAIPIDRIEKSHASRDTCT